MWSFILGLILGVAAKAVYDLFREEQLPAPIGLNAGRIEAMLDETSRTVRELREEVRQAVAGEGTLQEKAGRALSAAGETVAGARAGRGEAGPQGGSGGERAEGGLKLTSDEPSGPGPASSSGGGSQGPSRAGDGEGPRSSGGSAPRATHGTMQTMS
jgi:hypothetical protein